MKRLMYKTQNAVGLALILGLSANTLSAQPGEAGFQRFELAMGGQLNVTRLQADPAPKGRPSSARTRSKGVGVATVETVSRSLDSQLEAQLQQIEMRLEQSLEPQED